LPVSTNYGPNFIGDRPVSTDGVSFVNLPDRKEASYTIFIDANDSNKIKALNGTTGAIDYLGTNAATVNNAALAALTSGGKILIREGVYDISSATLSSAEDEVTIEGEGLGTVLSTTSTTADAVSLTGNYAQMRNLWVHGPGTMTAGAGINLSGSNQIAQLEDLLVTGTFYGIRNSRSLTWVRDCWIEPAPNGYGISIEGGNDVFIDRCRLVGNQFVSAAANGIAITNASGIWIRSSDVVEFQSGLRIEPASGQTTSWLFAEDCSFDTNTYYGILITPDSGAVAKGLNFIDCWTSSNTYYGVYTTGSGTLDGMLFSGHRCFNNGNYGIYIATGTNWAIDGGSQISGNGTAQSNTYHGVCVGAGISGWAIRNCKIGQMAQFSNIQANAIQLNAGGSDNYLIENNDLTGNLGVGVNNPNCAVTRIVRNNLGFVTANSGTATITSGQTYVNVTHALEETPGRVILTPTTDTGGKRFWVSAKSSSTFTITIDSTYTSNITFDWRATVGEGT
jgi:hypothetical protein